MAVRAEAAKAIEAILMVAQEPVETHLLAQLLEVAPAVVDELCERLATEYRDQDRGFELVRVAGGFRFQSHGDLSGYVERFVLEGQTARLSAAALETLAIVAYKQPMSRAQVAAIRGVNVDGVMRTLTHRGYLEEVGRDPGPGQAVLFGTSREFLERLGLDSLDDLPLIAELFPDAATMEALEKGLRTEPALDQSPVEDESGDADTVAVGEPESTLLDPAPAQNHPGLDGRARIDADSTPEGEAVVDPTGTDHEEALIDLDAPVEDIPVPSWALDSPDEGDAGAQEPER